MHGWRWTGETKRGGKEERSETRGEPGETIKQATPNVNYMKEKRRLGKKLILKCGTNA